jgi:hypothetical protein
MQKYHFYGIAKRFSLKKLSLLQNVFGKKFFFSKCNLFVIIRVYICVNHKLL